MSHLVFLRLCLGIQSDEIVGDGCYLDQPVSLVVVQFLQEGFNLIDFPFNLSKFLSRFQDSLFTQLKLNSPSFTINSIKFLIKL